MAMANRKIIIISILIGLLLVVAILNVNIANLFQEGNPLPVLWGIVKLELTDAHIVPFSKNKLIQKTGSETPLSNYLAEQGWTFKERLGAGIFYEKDDESLFVMSRMFSRYYVIYQLEDPF